jgi:hypothetical protein
VSETESDRGDGDGAAQKKRERAESRKSQPRSDKHGQAPRSNERRGSSEGAHGQRRHDGHAPRGDDKHPRGDDKKPWKRDDKPGRPGDKPARRENAPRWDDKGPRRNDKGTARDDKGPRRDDKGGRRGDNGGRRDDKGVRRDDKAGRNDNKAPRRGAGGAVVGGRGSHGRAGAEKPWMKEREYTEEEQRERALRSVRTRHDDPPIPEEITPRDLDPRVRVQLKTLSKENSDEVARHLVMAARLIEDEPELAHQHALSAERRAGRVGVVRETLAITAYATGDFALALRELRTFRRITGSDSQLPLMVDSERGVGRPDRALELGRSVDRNSLPNDVQVSLAIAMSGARLDRGQPESALAELEIPQLDPDRAFEWSPDLFHAYADVLEELHRDEEAERWRERAVRAEQALGREERASELEVVDIVEEEVEDELVEDELVEDELVEDELVEGVLLEDELVEDESLEGDRVEDETVEGDSPAAEADGGDNAVSESSED